MTDPRSILHCSSLAKAWLMRVQLSQSRVALLFEEHSWTCEAIHAVALTITQQFVERKLQSGDRVILMMENGPGFVAAFFAAQLLGLIPVPISPRSATSRVNYVVADCEASAVLVDETLSPKTLAQHMAQSYATILMPITLEQNHTTWQYESAMVEECAFIQYTSGSSGDAKGVMISHRAALANIRGFTASMDLRPGDVFSSLLPLFHDMGLLCFCLAPLFLGHTLVLYRAESLQLYRWLEDISVRKVSITGAPDSLLQIANRVVDDAQSYSFQGVRMLICGSEPIRRESIEVFGKRFDATHAIAPAYGMAELSLCASITPVGTAVRISQSGNVASGCAIEGVSIRILTEAGASTAEQGLTGEILVRSPAAMSGYWARPEVSAAAFDNEAYLKTGDIGFLDEDGYLYVIGRIKNLIIRSGEKYSAHELESIAQGIEGVRRAAVVQSQNDAGVISAILEVDRRMLNDPAALRSIEQQLRKRAISSVGIAADRCGFVASGRLPCTENGKLRHVALRTSIDEDKFDAVWPQHLEVNADAIAVA